MKIVNRCVKYWYNLLWIVLRCTGSAKNANFKLKGNDQKTDGKTKLGKTYGNMKMIG
jgi:hypothetical protein